METTDSGDQKSTNEGSIISNNYSHRLSPECQTLGKAQEKNQQGDSTGGPDQ